MGHAAHLFHNHATRPIAVAEFLDAVQSTCRPRFPAALVARPQHISLAVSGGVDSMAMAHLLAQLVKHHPRLVIADNPVQGVKGIIIDHKLRKGSEQEALNVAEQLRLMGIEPHIRNLRWRDVLPLEADPSKLPNIESLARGKRYKAIGRACMNFHATSLFFAHHRDDQYETVLMRLMGGHAYRGLQGIRDANDIPECYNMYGVYKSGLVDDQKRRSPFLSFKPPARQMRELRRNLRLERLMDPFDRLKHCLGADSTSAPFPDGVERLAKHRVPYLTPLPSEDGGIMIYRPLLEFDKDRLIATCEANGVEWFDDYTNKDPSLTTRNAIRHLVREHELPKALQKPSILGLSQRARKRVDLEEAEAHRLLTRAAAIEDFDPNAGTLLVRLPTFGPPANSSKNRYALAREEARKPRRRVIAAVAIRQLIEFATPEFHVPPLANLSKTVDRLFPELALESTTEPTPRAFSIGGVLFEQVQGGPRTKWFMSRAPLSSRQHVPILRLSSPHDASFLTSSEVRYDPPKHRRIKWQGWTLFKLWDGRFWFRLRRSVTARFHVEPLLPEALKPFRKMLPSEQQTKLDRVMKHYAPGKVRYTLPALYSAQTDGRGKRGAPRPDEGALRLTLLALPTLGFHVPGLERWLEYEVRHKKTDNSLLGLGRKRRGYLRVGCSPSRRRRRRRLAMYDRKLTRLWM